MRAFLARLPALLLALLPVGFCSVLLLVYAALPTEEYELVCAINGPLGFCMLLSLAVLVRTQAPNRGALWGWWRNLLAYVGSTSMSFYLFHIYFVSGSRLLLRRLYPMAPLSLHMVVGFLLGSLGPWMLIQILKSRPSVNWSVGLSGMPSVPTRP